MTKSDTIFDIRLALLSLGRDAYVGLPMGKPALTKKLKSLRDEQRKIGGILKPETVA
jgi:hypothetical protein